MADDDLHPDLLSLLHGLAEDIAQARGDLAEAGEDNLRRIAALQALRHRLDERTEGAITERVAEARRDGHSWTTLGKALGVSKQAATKVYGPRIKGE